MLTSFGKWQPNTAQQTKPNDSRQCSPHRRCSQPIERMINMQHKHASCAKVNVFITYNKHFTTGELSYFPYCCNNVPRWLLIDKTQDQIQIEWTQICVYFLADSGLIHLVNNRQSDM